jgi:eukaryotic-like serine/threonine-protein kinase
MSDSSRHERLRELFDQAVDQDSDGQAEVVQRLERDDPLLADSLRRLLIRDREGGSDRLRASEASAQEAAEELAPLVIGAGRRIGAFEVVGQLGAGGMGHIYRVVRRDGQVEQQAALKLVRPEALNPELLRRFSAERRMLAALDHPGVCRFLDAGMLSEGVPWVLMELVEGEHLLSHCDRRHLDNAARLHLLRRILAAVDHAHRNLVVHRDIKSANVLVSAAGEPKLLDFGIAKLLADDALGVTATADRFLTPMNAAPEQILGQATGIACDIYQLGLLAYELLCGEPAFRLSGLRAAEVERLILHHPPVPMSKQPISDEAARARGLPGGRALARRLSGDLDAIILRCLRMAPGDRYASVAELDADIARALDGRAVKARGGDRLYRLGRFVARHRVAVGLSATLAVTVLGGSVALAWQALEASRQRDLAWQERDRAQHAVAVLRDAFAAADPARVAGADIRARHILDAARERIAPLFDSQPALYAELARTLATVELDLASQTSAATLAEKGLQAAAIVGLRDETVRSLKLVRARALVGIGEYAPAQTILSEVEAEDGRLLPDRAMAQAQLAGRMLRTDEARSLLLAALAATDGRDAHDELATSLRWELSSVLRWGGELEASLRVLDDMLDWQLQSLTETHPRVVLTRLRQLNTRSQSGDAAAAIDDFMSQLPLLESHYGEDSLVAAQAHFILGYANSRADNLKLAIHHYRRAFGVFRVAIGEDHSDTLRVSLNLAEVLAREGTQVDEAEALYANALSRGEMRFGSGQSQVVYTRASFASFLAARGRWDEALDLMSSDAAALGAEVPSKSNQRRQAEVLRDILGSSACVADGRPSRSKDACARVRDLLDLLEVVSQFRR